MSKIKKRVRELSLGQMDENSMAAGRMGYKMAMLFTHRLKAKLAKACVSNGKRIKWVKLDDVNEQIGPNFES